MAVLTSLSWTELAAIVVLYGTLYMVILAIYRLWFSPIAQFPGPFLPRITFLYEFYYDWVKTGTYYLKVKEMHDVYGPIVRVSPDELHINQHLFYGKIFVPAAVRKSNNYHRTTEGTGFEDVIGAFGTHEMHRIARAPLDPFFSKAGILKAESRVVSRVIRLSERLKIGISNAQVVNLTYAFASLTNDVVSSLIFEQPSEYLEHPEYNQTWFQHLNRGTLCQPLFGHLPWVAKLFTTPLLRYLFEQITDWKMWDDKAQRQIVRAKLRPSDEAKNRADTTLVDHLVHNEFAAKNVEGVGYSRIAQLIQQAGSFNISQSLAAITTYLHLDDTKLKRLQSELAAHYRKDSSQYLNFRDLEKLPYLTGVIKEGLRMTTGSMVRAARIFPDAELNFEEWVIPKGVPISMTSFWMHYDSMVFPEPKSFIPERWLVDGEDLKVMNSCYVPFSKGSRNCVGQNLAYMEIYLTLAQIFRPGAPRIELYNTDESDVVPVHGLLFPLPKLDSQGVRARIYKSELVD